MASQLISSISPALLNRFPKDSVAVCAHDAGAASHIAAWLAPLHLQLRLCLVGPAESLFRAKLGNSIDPLYSLEEALEGAQILISGTGWSTDLEHRSRQLARRLGVPSVAVLDHWVNYRERFYREGKEELPDVLWVADAEAASLASSLFPQVPLQLLPNYWLDGLSSSVQTIRIRPDRYLRPRLPARRLLYLLEPIRVPWTCRPDVPSEPGEFQGLRYWLKQLPGLIDQGFVAPIHQLEGLLLRPHPSEPVGKYDALVAEHSVDWPISLDPSPELSDSLAWADAAFGCETQALVAAMACDLPAFSTIPSWAPPCRLPQASLKHLSLLEGI